jgi:hypothetical protein
MHRVSEAESADGCPNFHSWPTVIQMFGHLLACYQLPELNFPMYRGADKSLARPGRKQVTATEDFDFHVSYL